MRLLAITPIAVDGQELSRRQARYDRLAPAGVEVYLDNVGAGSHVPRALESADDVEASEAALRERYAAADASGYDAFLPDCVLDPLVGESRGFDVPVFGIGRLTAQFLSGLGASFGAVARNGAIAAELDRKLGTYGVPHTVRTLVLDLSVEDLADDATWAAAVKRETASLDCDYVINACSAVEVDQGGRRPVLVDPTATALRLLTVRRSLTEMSR